MAITVRTHTETFVHVTADRFEVSDHNDKSFLQIYGNSKLIAIYAEWLSIFDEEISREVTVGTKA